MNGNILLIREELQVFTADYAKDFLADRGLIIRMRSSLSYIIISLFCYFVCCLASTCAVKDSRSASQNSPFTTNIADCEEWKRAQGNKQGLGWDLVYEAILKNNGYGQDSSFWKWIHQDGPRPPVNELASEWKDEPIISSILVEVIGPEGSPGGFWLIRTTNHLYEWGFNRGKFKSEKEELFPLKDYDEAFDTIACWQQEAPVRSDTFIDGYYGFLSLYREGKSRQMLLTFRDFYLFDPRDDHKNSEDPNNWGRFWKILAPVLSSTAKR